MSYRGTGIFRRYVADEHKRKLAQELSCVLDTSEPYRAPDAPKRGMYDYEPHIDFVGAKVSCWRNNKRKPSDGTPILHY